ncbi:hypothetical protein [Roseofilum casamattae]|uniref:Uncharacterized protein n=1 Tax=Roseofilum casamattae BLCC-M143 TaxID=3022442 RepID=A0ABT7BZA2_9CYAN|nr:hypothetical protein [Roseofilum casamattae]MDJ1184527.1 hypothetical protein [Roseofilum casamattae BLCC-M143]
MTASDRYQSRLFNWLQHYSNEFIDKGTRALRHVKVAAEWTVQVVVYPLYWAFQSGRYVNHQFHTRVSPWFGQPDAPISEADTPILEVLQEVTQLDLPPIPAPETQTSVPIPSSPYPVSQLLIQGIATQLNSGKLVLVSTDNHCLDLLNPPQQQKIQDAIVRELANTAYQKRQDRTQSQPPLYSFAEERDLIPPVRRFWQLMAWMETSDVALAIDSFGESHLLQDIPPHPLEITESNSPWSVSLDMQPPSGYSVVSGRKMPVTYPATGDRKSTNPAAYSSVTDPWLTSEDLFGTAANFSSPASIPISQPQANDRPEANPDYIETTATASEYILSPAEKLFLWLDRVFLAIEDRVAQLLNWLNEEV